VTDSPERPEEAAAPMGSRIAARLTRRAKRYSARRGAKKPAREMEE
jgi:hypothetical protein